MRAVVVAEVQRGVGAQAHVLAQPGKIQEHAGIEVPPANHQAGQRAIALLTKQLAAHILQRHGIDPETGHRKLHARKGDGIHLLPTEPSDAQDFVDRLQLEKAAIVLDAAQALFLAEGEQRVVGKQTGARVMPGVNPQNDHKLPFPCCLERPNGYAKTPRIIA